MKTSTAVFSLLLAFGAVIFTVGCENEVDDTANNLPTNDMMVQDAAPPAPDGGATCRDCLAVGTWYRFDTLSVDTLAGEVHPAVPTLNAAWSADVENKELNILFEITAIEGDNVSLRAVNAALVDEDEICILPATAVDLNIAADTPDACDFTTTEPAGINVYAGTTEHSKSCAPGRAVPNSIPVEQLQLTNSVTADCSRITAGKVVEAAIPATALTEVCTCLAGLTGPASLCPELDPEYAAADGACAGCNLGYQPLGQLVALVGGGDLETDCTAADGNPAVCLSASFEAVRLDASPAECP